MKKFNFLPPSIPSNEKARQAALDDFEILDTSPTQDLDDITYLASQICGTPMALISLVDRDRQWFKSKVGVEINETSREISFCGHAINQYEVFVVEDARADLRFAENPLVVGPSGFQFYAGSPLKTSDGYHIGTICVADRVPRKLTDEQLLSLKALSRQVVFSFERKRLEAKLRDREKFMSNVLGVLPDLVSYIDPEFRYRYVNPSYQKWYQLKAADILGKQVQEIAGVEAFAVAKPWLELALRGAAQELTTAIPLKTDAGIGPRCLRIRYIPDQNPKGGIDGVFAVISDVTALKMAEESAIKKGEQLRAALQHALASEQSFRAFFENAPIGIVRVDARLTYASVNSAFEKFLGYTSQELKNMTVLDVSHPEDIADIREKAHRVYREPHDTFRFQKRYVHKTGKILWGAVTSRSYRIAGSEERQLYTVVEDITEARERENQLREAEAKLVSSAKMATLGEMAGGIAHEINNPLAIINAQAEFLQLRLGNGQLDRAGIAKDLEVMRKTSERIAKIVKGLRTFSRQSSGDPRRVTAIHQIIDETVALCGARFRSFTIPIEIDCPEGLACECESTQISQVLMNLLNNSFDSILQLPQKWIRIHAQSDQGHIKLRITDSGPGIPSAVVARMMEPFFTTKELGRGTGLGLSISRGIIESHGGQLSYELEDGHTSFLITIPESPAKSIPNY